MNFKFNPVSTAPVSDAKGIGLTPVAVHPDVQAQGKGLRLCEELGYGYCVVLANPEYYLIEIK